MATGPCINDIRIVTIYEQQPYMIFYERGKLVPDNIQAIVWICLFFLRSRRII